MQIRLSCPEKIVAFVFFMLAQLTAHTQPGNLDLSYNGTGQSYTTVQAQTDLAFASALLPDGKLLVAGSGYLNNLQDGFVIRGYTTSGQVDSSFGQFGRVFNDLNDINEQIRSIAVQPDGKILIGGATDDNVANQSKAVLGRFLSNGAIDSSFGINGLFVTDYNGSGNARIDEIKLLHDGKILALGTSGGLNGVLARHLPNGEPDLTFGTAGSMQLNTFQGPLSRMSMGFDVRPDGKIMVVGKNTVGGVAHFELSRYHANGQLDIGFNNSGYATTYIDNPGALAYSIKHQPDGKMVVVGNVSRPHGFLTNYRGADFVLARYHADGTLDNSFGAGGIVFTNIYENDVPSSVEVQPDGKILLAGSTYHIDEQGGRSVLIRYLANGAIDNNFSNNGTHIYSVNVSEGTCIGAHIANQRIYLTGWANDISTSGGGFNIYAVQNDVNPSSVMQVTLCPPVASSTFNSSLTGSGLQWQRSIDSVTFTNITNNFIFSGATSPSLTVALLPSSWYGYQFRCIQGGAVSNTFTIRFLNTWTGAQNSSWENPANWSCGSLPDENTDVVITSGSVTLSTNTVIRTLTLNPGATLIVTPGIQITITH